MVSSFHARPIAGLLDPPVIVQIASGASIFKTGFADGKVLVRGI
jgi:hypothetical protein